MSFVAVTNRYRRISLYIFFYLYLYSGEGDLHDGAYSSFGESIVLTGEGLFTDSSATYTLTLYPSSYFFSVYSTNNPSVATIGAVCIIIFTSFAFLLYDALVRRVVRDKQTILDAKRRFVRFVSHEV